ncbi:MAG: hypothetical protein Q9219_006815 [cf. Caloplaca sp. 3 TL-2023]
MPKPFPRCDPGPHVAAYSLENEEDDHDGHTMSMSYMVTLVHFFTIGEPRFDVIDSRCAKDDLAYVQKELDLDDRRITCRLFITEDLPRATYDLLEHTVGVEPRLLDDHRRNGHGPGFVGRPDLDIDKAPRLLSSTSVAIPFDLQLGSDVLQPDALRQGKDTMESDVASILKYHQLVNYLQYDWLSLSIKPPVPAIFFNTYRRLSFHTISGGTPTVIKDSTKIVNEPNKPFAKYPQRAIRTRMLLRQLIEEEGSTCITSQQLSRWIMTWIIVNTYVTFQASAEANVRSWHSVKSRIKTSPTRYMHIKRLCEQLRKLTEIKLHLMDKAGIDLRLEKSDDIELSALGAGDQFPAFYIGQQWHRSRQSLQWVLNDVDHVIRSNETRLQIDLVNTQIEESRKAMQQAETVKRLTALAFVFIPISTVCSAFGMNIRELSHGLPSIWIFATVAAAVAITTVVCSTQLAGNLFWAFLSLLNSSATAWQNWWQESHDAAVTEQVRFGLGVASIGANLAGVKPWQDPEKKHP